MEKTTMHAIWPMPEDETLRLVIDQIRRYGREKLVPMYKELENKSQFPEEAIKWMGEKGLLGLIIPNKYGGAGMTTEAAAYVARELAFWWPALYLIWTAHNLAVSAILYAGTEEQKRRLLPLLASGKNWSLWADRSGRGHGRAFAENKSCPE